MDSKEAKAYLAMASGQLEEAELAFREGRYSLCAFLSASSAENAVSALLIELDAKPSWKHRNSLVLCRLAQQADPETRSSLMELVADMKVLEPHLTKARYPILKGQELLSPRDFYTRQIAEELLARARGAYATVKNAL